MHATYVSLNILNLRLVYIKNYIRFFKYYPHISIYTHVILIVFENYFFVVVVLPLQVYDFSPSLLEAFFCLGS